MRNARTARFALSLSAFLALGSFAHAALEYRTKTENAGLYRTRELTPPPLAVLPKGENLIMIHKGPAASLMKTEGEIKGWISNKDVETKKPAKGRHYRLGEQDITGLLEPGMQLIINVPVAEPDLLSLTRSFNSEIVEAVDREQLEMRNGDN